MLSRIGFPYAYRIVFLLFLDRCPNPNSNKFYEAKIKKISPVSVRLNKGEDCGKRERSKGLESRRMLGSSRKKNHSHNLKLSEYSESFSKIINKR